MGLCTWCNERVPMRRIEVNSLPETRQKTCRVTSSYADQSLNHRLSSSDCINKSGGQRK